MIYYILYELIFNHSNQDWWLVKALNVFQYVTFRTAYASVTALLISLGLGNEPVDRHPVEFIDIMSQTFWFLAVATAAILVVCIREGRARRSPAP